MRPTEAGVLCGGLDRKTLHRYAERYGVRLMRMAAVQLPDGTSRQGERRYHRHDMELLAEHLSSGDLNGRIVAGEWVPIG